MVFPATPLGVTVELYLGTTLGWVDITPDVRLSSAHSGGGIQIADRGRTNEGGEADTTRCSLVLNNAGGKYSPRNPSSPYYGLLGRNTPIRVRVADTDPGGAVALTGPAKTPAAVTTPPHTSLNVAGDLDVRIWVRLPTWVTGDGCDLVGKYIASGTDRGWYLNLNGAGQPNFAWSPDGTFAARIGRTCNAAVTPAADGSLALRATLTLSTGVVRFYTAPSLAGPWTQLGSDSAPAGATTVAPASGAGIELGSYTGITDPAAAGELYGFELRTAGTLRTSPDFTTLRAGDTSLTDAQGRVWTLNSAAVAIDRGCRFLGEVSSWPQRWDPSGNDQWVPIQAAGPTRRMSQGNSPVISPLRRTLTAIDPAGYLPLEDGSEATRPATATTVATNATSNLVTYGQELGRLAGSRSVAKMTSAASRITTSVTPRPASTTFWSTLVFFKLTQMPVGGDQTYLKVYFTGGTVARWDFQLSGGGYRWIGYDRNDTVVSDQAFGNGDQPPNDWLMMYVEWSVSGGNVTLQPWVANAGEGLFSTASWAYPGTLGYPTKMEVVGNTHFQDALISHLAVDDQRIFLSADFAALSTGYAGETAGARIARLAAEEGVTVTFWGSPNDTTPCGPQPIAPLLDVLRDAAKVDGGILLEARGHLGLHYRTRVSLYNQGAIGLDYAAGHISDPFQPTDDDDATRNDITVSRTNGASARVVLTTGTLSTANPPAGVGTYDTSETVNVAGDDQLPDQARWRLHLGTVDEARYPRIRLNLAGLDQTLTRQVALADAGDVASIAGLPAWLPPGPAKVMVLGYTEMIDAYEWSTVWNASPASPWDVATVDGEARVASDNSATSGLAVGAMSMLLTSTVENKTWTEDPADFPLDLRVGAERVTASAIARSFVDSYTRTVAAGGWGSPWTIGNGTASGFSVNGSEGLVAVNTVNVEQHAVFDVGTATQDMRLWCTVPITPAGAPINWGVLLRYVDANSYLWADAQVGTDSSITVRLIKRLGGAVTVYGTEVSSVTHSTTVARALRAEVNGNVFRARVWSASGTEQPSLWDITATDSSFPLGTRAGAVCRLMSGNTNGTVTFRFDNAVVANPQLVSLSARGVNGVTRTWGAGTEVDVWQPAIVAL